MHGDETEISSVYPHRRMCSSPDGGGVTSDGDGTLPVSSEKDPTSAPGALVGPNGLVTLLNSPGLAAAPSFLPLIRPGAENQAFA
jgi:hypothetical protein